MMHRIFGRAISLIALVVLVGALPALAIPVSAPFGGSPAAGTDTFARAIHFTGSGKPTNSSNGAIQNLYRGAGTSRDSGVIMSPVGDGSYVCTAAVYPGASYSYYFSFRNRTYDADSTVSWLTTAPAAERDQDINRVRSVTIPSTATHGYYIYNAYGDASVLGYQGSDTIEVRNNKFVQFFGGYQTIANLNAGDTYTRIGTESGDTKFANMSGSNAYGIDAVQIGDSAILLSWSFSIGGSEAFVPSVQGAARFSSTDGSAGDYGSSKQYGFRIWRCTTAATPGTPVGLVFTDITANLTGDTNWSDNDNDPFNGQSFTDTSIGTSNNDTTYIYLVTFYNAYQYLQSDTTRGQPFSGGWDSVTSSPAIRVFFIVEHFQDEVVFPDGNTHGKVYLTPYIDNVRRPDLRFQAPVVKFERGITS